jgi:hypothetical protein
MYTKYFAKNRRGSCYPGGVFALPGNNFINLPEAKQNQHR